MQYSATRPLLSISGYWQWTVRASSMLVCLGFAPASHMVSRNPSAVSYLRTDPVTKNLASSCLSLLPILQQPKVTAKGHLLDCMSAKGTLRSIGLSPTALLNQLCSNVLPVCPPSARIHLSKVLTMQILLSSYLAFWTRVVVDLERGSRPHTTAEMCGAEHRILLPMCHVQ